MISFTDTHCHPFKESFDNIEEYISNAKNNNVNKIIVAGDSIATSKEMLELASKYTNIYPCIGIHPESCNEDYNEIKKILNNRVVAIGEIGLDYYYSKDDRDKQISLFENQLKIAEEFNLPVVIHSREATKDTIDILSKYKVKGVIHCFSGSYETAMTYIKMGFYIGVGGVITFKNAKLKDVIEKLALDTIVLETDSPYLAPTPYRGSVNESKNILEIAKFISELKNVSLEKLSIQTEKNVKNIFDI